MKYIIMCGSNHGKINGTPRQLVEIGGERVVDRTIRLLREHGAKDIAITATDAAFMFCDAPVINYDSSGEWTNCFYRVEDPVCYIFGDVYFSPDAIETIVGTNADTVQFFASKPPFAPNYIKPWAEPFAFKVWDPAYFYDKIDRVKQLNKERRFCRDPIAWEVWQVVKDTPINQIDYNNYVVINDYTCDIDDPQDITRLKQVLGGVWFG